MGVSALDVGFPKHEGKSANADEHHDCIYLSLYVDAGNTQNLCNTGHFHATFSTVAI